MAMEFVTGGVLGSAVPAFTVILAAGWFGELVAAAVIDARNRRFPNALAAAFALTGALIAVTGGVDALMRHALAALIVCGALTGSELLWRRMHGGCAGMGMGDIKFLAAAMLARPVAALAAFTMGLLLMAAACVVRREHALPLLPFVAAAVPLVLAAGWAL